jgi:membrane protease YdiL (CAAX protease family)
MEQKPLRNIIFYTLSMLVCGIIGRFIERDNTTGQPGIGQGLWIVSPVLLAITFTFIFKTSWKDWAIKTHFKGNGHYYLLATLLYPALTFVVVGIGNVLAVNTFPNGIGISLPLIFSNFLAALLLMFFKNIFEEFAWRGYLTGEVEKLGWQRGKQYLLIGLIWAAWHLPFLDVLLKSYSTENYWTFLPRFFIFIISAAFIYGELRRLVQSVWVAVWLHTVGNAIAAPFILPEIFKISSDKMPFFGASGDSVLFMTLHLIAAWYFYKKYETHRPNPTLR